MKKVFALSIGLLLFASCEQDTIVSESEGINLDQSSLTRGAKVDVCHNGRIINVSVNALGGHQGHGDAVDMDGDGYFDIENDCSDTDCDDTNAAVNPAMEEVCDNGIDDNCNGEIDENCVLPAEIGDIREGGVVFWVDSTGLHGLICAMSDYVSTKQWGCYDADLPNVPNVISFPPSGSGAEIRDGMTNTNAILTDCSTAPAALAAGSYGPEWFLPSAKELNEMYLNRAAINATATANGGANFRNNPYWSSTEFGTNFAWRQDFNNGGQYPYFKFATIWVRVVRAF